jgi:hypothetical protein
MSPRMATSQAESLLREKLKREVVDERTGGKSLKIEKGPGNPGPWIKNRLLTLFRVRPSYFFFFAGAFFFGAAFLVALFID